MTNKNTICLWFDGSALDAATFYAETFPDSAVGAVFRAPSDGPRKQAGQCPDGRVYCCRHSLHRAKRRPAV